MDVKVEGFAELDTEIRLDFHLGHDDGGTEKGRRFIIDIAERD